MVQRVRLYTGVIAARARKKHAGRTMPVFAQFSHGFPPEQGGGQNLRTATRGWSGGEGGGGDVHC